MTDIYDDASVAKYAYIFLAIIHPPLTLLESPMAVYTLGPFLGPVLGPGYAGSVSHLTSQIEIHK